MRKVQLLVSALLVFVLLTAFAPTAVPAAPAKQAWQEKWKKTVEAAKKEGKVTITWSLATSSARTAIKEAFKKAYGIPVEDIVGRTPELAAKVLAERRAGLYNYDVFQSGGTTLINVLKPAGVTDPLDQALILPDVTDPDVIKKVWWQGKLWWVDKEHMHLSPALRLNFPIAINTNLVREGEIKSYRDLLDPKWQGKVVSNDITTSGVGSSFLSFAVDVLGWDYLTDLAKSKPIMMRDERLMLEWLSHGKVAVVVAPKMETLFEFVKLGAPIKGIIPAEGTWLVGGDANLSIYNHQPHPNAAKVYINWALSREGQTATVTAAGFQSNRLDVPTDHLRPEEIRQTGAKYYVKESEEVYWALNAKLKKSNEIFGPMMK